MPQVWPKSNNGKLVYANYVTHESHETLSIQNHTNFFVRFENLHRIYRYCLKIFLPISFLLNVIFLYFHILPEILHAFKFKF
jgi:hypothetical protein